MSANYPAGQYDDSFCPRKLGNWDAGAKESYPSYTKFRHVYPGWSKTEVIADSRGHLLPGIPRGDKSKAWGLLKYFMQDKYVNSTEHPMAMTGPGRQCPDTATMKKLKKLPKLNPQKAQENHNNGDQDILLEYLQDLSLPIVWIIGPPTKNTFQKRKAFSKQLASNLGFGYVNLDEKIQEWKDRQATCTCPHPHAAGRSACNTATSAHSLASTSIAPCKLPTNVSPRISSELPVTPDMMSKSQTKLNTYSLTMLDSQRIAFDTALPMERNKILELYKFAMAECLPCGGFILDSVPFDLVEGLAFEKVFYPSALAIYFKEGATQKKNFRPQDRRITSSSNSSEGQQKYLMNPQDEKTKKLVEHQYMKMKSHKRLGAFSIEEGEKICKQFGSKTIRIINAEDVEKNTMEFLNELVKRNLDKYEQITNGGEYTLDVDDLESEEHIFPGTARICTPQRNTSRSAEDSSAFVTEGRELDEDLEEEGRSTTLEDAEEYINDILTKIVSLTSTP